MSDRPSAAPRLQKQLLFSSLHVPACPPQQRENSHPVLCCFHPRPIPATRRKNNCSSAFLQPETLFLALSDFHFYACITSPLGALLLRVTSRITYLRSYHYLTAAMAIGWGLASFPQRPGRRFALGLRQSAAATLRARALGGTGNQQLLRHCHGTTPCKKQLLVHPSPGSKAKTTILKPLRNWKPSKNSCCFSLFCTSPLHCFVRFLQRHQKNRSVVVSQPETLWKQLLSPLHRPPHRGVPKPETFF